MKIFSLINIIVVSLLVGCTTYVPVEQIERPFPELANTLKEPCPNLIKIEGKKTTLSELLKTVSDNYALYYQCQAKVNGWNTWYHEQREIFERVR